MDETHNLLQRQVVKIITDDHEIVSENPEEDRIQQKPFCTEEHSECIGASFLLFISFFGYLFGSDPTSNC